MASPAIGIALAAAVTAGVAGATGALADPPGHSHGHGHAYAYGHANHGNGAVKTAVTKMSMNLDQCRASDGTGAPTGFAVLNAPGAPTSSPGYIRGTVALKKAAEHDTTFDIAVAVGGSCHDTGSTLTTNGVGNGTGSFTFAVPTPQSLPGPLASTAPPTYYVVLTKSAVPSQLSQLPKQITSLLPGEEAYATAPTPLS